MRSSVVTFVLVAVLAVLVLVFGLSEARTRQKKADQIENIEEKLDKILNKLDDLEKRLQKLEARTKK